MTAQTNMDLVRAWVDAINHNDVEAELACWQPDAQMTVVPLGVTFKGVDEFRRGGVKSSAMVGTQPLEGRKQITHLFGSGDDWVCVEYDVQASVDGPIVLQNVIVVPAGVSRNLELKVCVIAHVRNGKMDVAREYWDSASMARQLHVDSALLEAMYASMSSTD